MATRQRILDTALDTFGRTGIDGASLDDLARSLGLRKQSILYYFPSKVALFEAVVDEAADAFIAELDDVLADDVGGVAATADVWEQVEGTVRVVFRLAVQRPALLGLLREASRPGSPVAAQLTSRLATLIEAAQHNLEIALKEGTVKGDDARLLLFSLYSTIMGVATEVEVLRAMGIEPTLRSLAERRIELLRFLREALISEGH